jgi:hypothetical protein
VGVASASLAMTRVGRAMTGWGQFKYIYYFCKKNNQSVNGKKQKKKESPGGAPVGSHGD